MQSSNIKLWAASVAISCLAFLACNGILNRIVLEPLFHPRVGRPAPPELTEPEIKEILARAGGLSVVEQGQIETPSSPRTLLLSSVGIAVSFVDSPEAHECYIKWFPSERRPGAINDAPPVETASYPGELGPMAPADRKPASILDDVATGHSVDPAAVNLVLSARSGNEVTYRFSYDNVETESGLIISQSPLWFSPVRPVEVRTDLHALVRAYVHQIQTLHTAHAWRNSVFNGKKGGGYTPPSDEDSRLIARAVVGVLALVFTREDSKPLVNPARPLPNLLNVTLPSRILNGSNWMGVIQLVIVIVFVRGMYAVKVGDVPEKAVAETCLESLPALGFLGTLLGMAVAFSAGLDDRTNLSQSLTLAIASSAIALGGALVILWCRR